MAGGETVRASDSGPMPTTGLPRGAEDSITPGLAETRRSYADAYRQAVPAAEIEFSAWVSAGKALPTARAGYVRQIAHAMAATALLRVHRKAAQASHRGKGDVNMTTSPAIATALEQAGAALRALGEEVVLLAFYRAAPGFDGDRYSVRLELDRGGGTALGVQESAASPARALAKALAAREEKRAALAAEAEIRAQIERGTGPASRLAARSR